MSLGESQVSVEVVELEREAIRLATRIDQLERVRFPAAEQIASAQWYAPVSTRNAASNCTFTGQAVGCGGFGLPNAMVTIADYTTHATYWTGQADSNGSFSGSAALPPQQTTCEITVAVASSDPFAARFVAPYTGITYLSPGSNNLRTVGSPATATGYACSKFLYYPLKTTLKLADSVNGTFTLVFGAGGWSGSRLVPYAGCSSKGCPAFDSVHYAYTLGPSQNQGFYYYIPISGLCPNPNGLSSRLDVTFGLTVTSVSPFLATGSLAAGNSSYWYCGTAVSWTLSE